MEIEDLRTGMLILTGEDELRMVVGNKTIKEYPRNGTLLTKYTFKQSKDKYSIKKVFAEPIAKYIIDADRAYWLSNHKFLDFDHCDTEIIWEPAKIEEMTIEDVCKELGREIKIVKG